MAYRTAANHQRDVFVFRKGKRGGQAVGDDGDIGFFASASAISMVVLPLSRITVIPSSIMAAAAWAMRFSGRLPADNDLPAPLPDFRFRPDCCRALLRHRENG
jgi:hypothetical protein